MTALQITYLTEDPARDYSKAIRKATTLGELKEAIKDFESIAPDALEAAREMSVEDFTEFKKQIKYAARTMPEEWTRKFVDRWGVIVMPSWMIKASMVAEHFHVPWGTAFIRLKEEGKL